MECDKKISTSIIHFILPHSLPDYEDKSQNPLPCAFPLLTVLDCKFGQSLLKPPVLPFVVPSRCTPVETVPPLISSGASITTSILHRIILVRQNEISQSDLVCTPVRAGLDITLARKYYNSH